jgi:hypothetical protein
MAKNIPVQMRKAAKPLVRANARGECGVQLTASANVAEHSAVKGV